MEVERAEVVFKISKSTRNCAAQINVASDEPKHIQDFAQPNIMTK